MQNLGRFYATIYIVNGFVVPGFDGPSYDGPAFVGPSFVGSPNYHAVIALFCVR